MRSALKSLYQFCGVCGHWFDINGERFKNMSYVRLLCTAVCDWGFPAPRRGTDEGPSIAVSSGAVLREVGCPGCGFLSSCHMGTVVWPDSRDGGDLCGSHSELPGLGPSPGPC